MHPRFCIAYNPARMQRNKCGHPIASMLACLHATERNESYDSKCIGKPDLRRPEFVFTDSLRCGVLKWSLKTSA